MEEIEEVTNTVLIETDSFDLNIWNILFIAMIILAAIILKRIIHRSLKRYLLNANIKVEGKRVTWLRLFSQSIYIIAAYGIYLYIKTINRNFSLEKFLDHEILKTKYLTLSYWHILSVIIIFFLAGIAVRLIQLIIAQRLRRRKDYDPGVEYVYVQISKYIIYMIAIFMSMNAVFHNVNSLLTGTVGIFVGIGLGLQDVFKDFFAGIVLLLEGNLKVGDVIELPDPAGNDLMVAKIVKITVRTTQIETREGNVLIIPNTKLTQDMIENWSHGSELSRFMITVGVAYGSDTENVVRLLKQAALAHPKVKKSEGVTVRLADFAESSLLMELIFWADQSWDINNTKSEIRLEIDRLFKENKVNIPFPQMDLHIASDKREKIYRKSGHYDE